MAPYAAPYVALFAMNEMIFVTGASLYLNDIFNTKLKIPTTYTQPRTSQSLLWNGQYSEMSPDNLLNATGTMMSVDVSGNVHLISVVPLANLPTSILTDILEVANYAALPVTGAANKIYLTLDTSTFYRWIVGLGTYVIQPGDVNAAINAAIATHDALNHPHTNTTNTWSAAQTFGAAITVTTGAITASASNATFLSTTTTTTKSNTYQSTAGVPLMTYLTGNMRITPPLLPLAGIDLQSTAITNGTNIDCTSIRRTGTGTDAIALPVGGTVDSMVQMRCMSGLDMQAGNISAVNNVTASRLLGSNGNVCLRTTGANVDFDDRDLQINNGHNLVFSAGGAITGITGVTAGSLSATNATIGNILASNGNVCIRTTGANVDFDDRNLQINNGHNVTFNTGGTISGATSVAATTLTATNTNTTNVTATNAFVGNIIASNGAYCVRTTGSNVDVDDRNLQINNGHDMVFGAGGSISGATNVTTTNATIGNLLASNGNYCIRTTGSNVDVDDRNLQINNGHNLAFGAGGAITGATSVAATTVTATYANASNMMCDRMYAMNNQQLLFQSTGTNLEFVDRHLQLNNGRDFVFNSGGSIVGATNVQAGSFLASNGNVVMRTTGADLDFDSRSLRINNAHDIIFNAGGNVVGPGNVYCDVYRAADGSVLAARSGGVWYKESYNMNGNVITMANGTIVGAYDVATGRVSTDIYRDASNTYMFHRVGSTMVMDRELICGGFNLNCSYFNNMASTNIVRNGSYTTTASGSLQSITYDVIATGGKPAGTYIVSQTWTDGVGLIIGQNGDGASISKPTTSSCRVANFTRTAGEVITLNYQYVGPY